MFARSQTVNYRSRWREDCLRGLCGFANARGGTLYLGVNEKGEISGLSPSDCEFILSRVPDIIRETLHIIPEVTLLEEGDLKYISIKVGLSVVPVSYNGVYYVRSGKFSQRASGKEIEELFGGLGGDTWDKQRSPLMQEKDLDPGAVKAYRLAADRKDGPGLGDREYLESLHVRSGNRFTNAAALMFTENPEYWVKEAYTRAGFFDEDGNVLYQEKVTGPLYKQAWETLQTVLARYIRLYGKVLPFPEAAVKEALLNAVVHKEYSAAEPVQVRVTKDSVRVINAGYLPANWSMETLMGVHVAAPRNPLIAELFARAGYTDCWGTGLERMRALCEKAGLPAPRLSVSGFGFSVEFQTAGSA